MKRILLCLSLASACTIDAKAPQLAGYAADAGYATSAGAAAFASAAAYAADAGYASSSAYAADLGFALNAANAANAVTAGNALALGSTPAASYLHSDSGGIITLPGDINAGTHRFVVGFADGGTLTVISTAGAYCGVTAQLTGNVVPATQYTGYPAVKKLCEAACHGSPTAHVCSQEELTRFLSLGGQVTDLIGTDAVADRGWVNGPTSVNGSSAVNDCGGWRGSGFGIAFYGNCSGPAPAACNNFYDVEPCTNPHPFICCD